MSTDEQSALNRRVAVLLGHSAAEMGRGWALTLHGVPVSILRFSEESGAWSQCPDYCTDPVDADLVRQGIERRGWEWDLSYRDTSNWRAVLPRYCCEIHGPFEGIVPEGEDGAIYRRGDSPHHALCLAFLAAHDAQQEQEAKP